MSALLQRLPIITGCATVVWGEVTAQVPMTGPSSNVKIVKALAGFGRGLSNHEQLCNNSNYTFHRGKFRPSSTH